MARSGFGRTSLLVLTLLIASSASAVRADLTAIPYSGTGAGTNTHNATLGWKFRANANIQITKMGMYDVDWYYAPDPGLFYSHDIGLWDASGTLLFSTMIVPTDPKTGRFFFHDLDTPYALTTGQEYVIGVQLRHLYGASGDDAYCWETNPATVPTAPEITWLEERMASSTSLTYPNTSNYGAVWFGPNFQFVPEPMTLGLLAFGGLVLLKRRRRA
jgi:hypothetical protein